MVNLCYFNVICIYFSFLEAVTIKFGEKTFVKKWPELRKALNQKCLDTKRESLKNAAEGVDNNNN